MMWGLGWVIMMWGLNCRTLSLSSLLASPWLLAFLAMPVCLSLLALFARLACSGCARRLFASSARLVGSPLFAQRLLALSARLVRMRALPTRSLRLLRMLDLASSLLVGTGVASLVKKGLRGARRSTQRRTMQDNAATGNASATDNDRSCWPRVPAPNARPGFLASPRHWSQEGSACCEAQHAAMDNADFRRDVTPLAGRRTRGQH